MGPLTLVALLGAAIGIGRAARMQLAEAFFFTAAFVILALYVGALAGVLWWTALAIHIVGVALLAREALRHARHATSFAFPVPLGVLVLLCGWFLLVHGADQYFLYDEYAHWGVFIKEMLALDGLWTGDTNSLHPRYPPGAPLWQYLFNAFQPASEARTYFAHFVLLLAPLLMLWNNASWRQPAWIAAILAVVVLAVANFGLGVSTLYVDQHIGAWYLGTLLTAVADKNLRWSRVARYAAPLAALALLKDTGLALAVSGAMLIAALAYRRQNATKNTRQRAGETTATLALLLAPALLCVQVWSWNRDTVGAAHDVQSVSGFVSGIAGGTDDGANTEQDAEIRRRLTETFFDQQISNSPTSWEYNEFTYEIRSLFTDSWRLTTFGLLVAFVAWWAVICFGMLEGEARRTWLIVATGVLMTAVVYITALHSSYRFSFGERGPELPSYVRYVHIVALPMFLLCFCPLLPAFGAVAPQAVFTARGQRVSRRVAVFAAAAAAAFSFETPHLQPILEANPKIPRRVAIEPLLEPIRSSVGPSRLWIYFPGDENSHFFGRMVQYLLVPTPVAVEDDPHFLEGDAGSVQAAWQPFDYAWIAELPSVEAGVGLTRFSGGMAQPGLYRVRPSASGHVRLEHLGADQ